MSIKIAQWRPEYETGNNIIDEQHKSLFSTINALNSAMLEGQGEALLEKTLDSLKDYTIVHFDTEEKFMLDHKYPDYTEHKQKHEALKAKVLSFEKKNYDDLSKLTNAVSHFLTDWLIHHIKDEDKKMILFCRHDHGSESKPDHLSSVASDNKLEIAQWRTEYETGYILIDNQHQSLFHAINALNSAMLIGRGEELLERTLESLKIYTTIHFETEEEFMLKNNYPGYLEHKAKHKLLRQQVEEFNQQIKLQNTSQITINVSHFLTDWLIHHIKDEDKKMIAFFRQKREQNQK
ncbi:bacteriohemerythrin [Cuspidothrix issatschenkoi]|uniref:bacteriohemerythrin n=1 Tax=Cuspidothrix issatschenkoi TaxID=230752 RepID=UPI001D141F27|nr:bacteriohemerythrin [Cuspidothrix issatschenkoi]